MDKNRFRRFYVMNSEIEHPLISLADNDNASQRAWAYIVANMSNSNNIILKQSEAAKNIGCTRQHLGSILKKLCEKKYIVKTGKDQVNNVYMVNPNHVWKGKAAGHDIAIGIFLKSLISDL